MWFFFQTTNIFQVLHFHYCQKFLSVSFPISFLWQNRYSSPKHMTVVSQSSVISGKIFQSSPRKPSIRLAMMYRVWDESRACLDSGMSWEGTGWESSRIFYTLARLWLKMVCFLGICEESSESNVSHLRIQLHFRAKRPKYTFLDPAYTVSCLWGTPKQIA